MSFVQRKEVTSLLSEYEIRKTADSIISMQTVDGAIAKTPEGSIDVWNHLEAAMALLVAGCEEESNKALLWSFKTQNANGSWYSAYNCDNTVVDKSIDTNQCSYLATAMLHNFIFTKNKQMLLYMWPAVVNALNFVISHQGHTGCISWSIEQQRSRHDRDMPAPRSLFAASCSIYQSLKSAVRIADLLLEMSKSSHVTFSLEKNKEYYDELGIRKIKLKYSSAAHRLRDSLIGYMTNTSHKADYIDKTLYAMDHYYNILASIVVKESLEVITKSRKDFILQGWGVRCLRDKDWFTAAETAEWAIAEASIGNTQLAAELFATTFRHRLSDGSYLTGSVYPNGNSFPLGERSSYSAAAIILANDVISGGMTSLLFRDYDGK